MMTHLDFFAALESWICFHISCLKNTAISNRDEDPTFFSLDPDQIPDPTQIRNEEKNIFLFWIGWHKIRSYNHHFKLEFVDPGLYFDQD